MMIVILVDLLIVAVLLTADLVSKHYAAKYLLSHGGSYEAIKDVLTFRYSENKGAAFGIFENSRVFLSVFVGIVVLALIGFMAYHIVKKKYKEKLGVFLHVSLSFILAGGIGNLVDRIALGYVRDFIEYTFIYTLFKKHFAICNLADVFLTVGVIMVVIYLIVLMVDEAKKGKALLAEKDARQADAAMKIEEPMKEKNAPPLNEEKALPAQEEPLSDVAADRHTSEHTDQDD